MRHEPGRADEVVVTEIIKAPIAPINPMRALDPCGQPHHSLLDAQPRGIPDEVGCAAHGPVEIGVDHERRSDGLLG